MQFELTSTLLWLGESHVRILVVLVLVASVFLAVVKGRSKVVLVHAKATVDITSRSPNGKLRKQSLLARIKQSCPSLVGRFVPSPFLANGHFQTLYAGASARVSDKSFSYERELLNLPDGGVVAIDWAKPAVQDHEDYAVKPILILLHGLGGGSYDKYILDVIPLALAAGFRVAALNSRGCGGIAIATPQLYSGSYTQDVRLMIDHIHSKNHPSVPMVGVGFSLGANILMKCVGEDGVHSKLTACVSVANPYDLHVGQTFLHSTWMGKQFYSRIMADGLKAFFKKHQNVFDKNPDYEGHIDPIVSEQVHKTTYLSEFDESITRRMFGFRTVYEYYRCGSSAQFIPAIAIPTLLLSDLNDPIAMKESIPYADILGNPNLVLAVTKRGGHLGWYEGWLPRRWYPKPIIEFATMICKAHSSLPANMKFTLNERRGVVSKHVHYSPRHFGVVFPQHTHSSNASNAKTAVTAKETLPVGTESASAVTESSKDPKKAVSKTKTAAASKKTNKGTILSYIVQYWRRFVLSRSLEARMVKGFACFAVCVYAAFSRGSKNNKHVVRRC